MTDVFISYKREERARCEGIYRRLTALGLDVWFDAELTTGKSFDTEIEQVVSSAKSVVVLWSPASIQSEWCREEALVGKKRGVLVAIMINACEPPFGFGSTHFETLASDDFEYDHVPWLKVLRRIGDLAGRPGLADYAHAVGKAAALLRDCVDRHPADPLAESATQFARLLTTLTDQRFVSPREAPPDAAPRPASGPAAPSGPHAAWNAIDASLDTRDYDDFLEVYPHAGEAFEARRRRRRLTDWDQVDKRDASQVTTFIASGCFPALEVAARRVAEGLAAEADRARENAVPVGSSATSARAAAITGRSTTTRSYAIALNGVPEWPRLQMVAVTPGRFAIGSPQTEARWDGYFGEEEPQTEIHIDHVVALGRGPVSVAAFSAFIAQTGHYMGDRAFVFTNGNWENPLGKGWRDPGFHQDPSHPATCVSWRDALAFINWLNGQLGLIGRPDAYRLPSEAEWEFCCRAGSDAPFAFGETLSTDQANFDGRTSYGPARPTMIFRKGTTRIGAFRPNALGFDDMHGNVWEWCQDPWNEGLDQIPQDGRAREDGDPERRLLRGGAWYVPPEQARSAMRFWFNANARGCGIGFRLARTLLP